MTNRANTALKNLHSTSDLFVQECTKSATITLQQLKIFEECCLARQLLPSRPTDALPAWFLADTEKNIFLWKNSKQLANMADYEFWIDIPELVEKRVRQIATFETTNPFAGSLDEQKREVEYLKALVSLMKSTEMHLQALGEVQQEVLADLEGVERSTKVVLPVKKASVEVRQ